MTKKSMSEMALQQAWSVLKSMYREPKNQKEIDHNQNIMRNPMGFDTRWCATPGCNAKAKRGSHYCVPCNVRREENENYEEPPMPKTTDANLRDY